MLQKCKNREKCNYGLGMAMLVCNPNIQGTEAGGLWVVGSLGYIRDPFLVIYSLTSIITGNLSWTKPLSVFSAPQLCAGFWEHWGQKIGFLSLKFCQPTKRDKSYKWLAPPPPVFYTRYFQYMVALGQIACMYLGAGSSDSMTTSYLI